MKKALFVASIVVFSMLVPELFSGSCDLLADPAGCCMQRPNINVLFIRNNLTFAACQQLNLALDNDNISSPQAAFGGNCNAPRSPTTPGRVVVPRVMAICEGGRQMDQPIAPEEKIGESSEAAKTEVPDDTLKSISDISQSASYAYVLYLSFLAYCTLTILATTDSHIIRNDTTVLPLVSLPVPFSIFSRAAPLIAIGLFIYFEMYHNRVTGMLNDARRNYAPVDRRKLYPWLVTLGEQPDPGFVGLLERLIVTFSLWWTLPIVLWLFALWTLRRHALTDCIFLSVVNLLGVVLVFSFWRRYRPSASFGRYLVLSVAIVAQAVLLGLLIFILKGYPGASYVNAN